MTAFEDFILQHQDEDINQLLLRKEKYAGIDITLAVNTILTRKKLKDKVPSFYRQASLVYPTRLSGEQCSSEDTALYKAQIAASKVPHFRLADLSGGLGVDCWAFAQEGEEILHNERDRALSEAVQANFKTLGIDNCRFSCKTLIGSEKKPDMGDNEACIAEILADFQADILFLDPARRDSQGGKVFRLEDCSPNVLALKDELFQHARYLFLKLSPMADIHAICESLGPQCQEVYVIGSQNECKELLIWLDREHTGEYRVTVRESESEFCFSPEEEKAATILKAKDLKEIKEAECLFEPSKAVLKSGAFKLLCQRFGLKKLADSTHIYIGKTEEIPLSLGKCHRIELCLPFGSRTIKEIGKEYPSADVSARNLPLSSDELKKRLGGRKIKGKGGEGKHIFALACESAGGEKENLLFVTQTFRRGNSPDKVSELHV